MLSSLLGLLTLVSYVDRLYQEIANSSFPRDFQDNIDSFEQLVEPRLGVTRSVLRLSGDSDGTGHRCHAMVVGFTRVFISADRAWSVYEVLEPR